MEHCMARRVLMAEVSKGQVRSRPKFGGWKQRDDGGGCATMLEI